MKKVFKSLLALVIIFSVNMGWAQDSDSPPHMWENLTITPHHQHLKTLRENMRKHNQKYHAKGSAYSVNVFSIQTGPDVGKLVWSMGPIKYASLDGRPAEGGHDDDWQNNVMPYVKEMNNSEYWEMDLELSNTDMISGKLAEYPLLYLRYHEVAKGQGYQLKGLLEKMSGAIKAMDGVHPFGFYDNQFRQGYDNGRHLATVSFMKNWAELDSDWNFKEAFIKAHGEGAWQPWIDGMDQSMRNSYDEIWMYDKYMSGE